MSKIAEQKALEAYQKDKLTAVEAVNRTKRFGYIQGYDQAMQDFLEKAMEYFKGKPIHHFWVEEFKKYMQDKKQD